MSTKLLNIQLNILLSTVLPRILAHMLEIEILYPSYKPSTVKHVIRFISTGAYQRDKLILIIIIQHIVKY